MAKHKIMQVQHSLLFPKLKNSGTGKIWGCGGHEEKYNHAALKEEFQSTENYLE